jgi:hypothetical protein
MSRLTSLEWRNVTPSNSQRFLVAGTELNVALFGEHKRYQICEIRAYDAEGFADRVYAVRDAYTVSDAQVREGIRSKVVARKATLDEAIAFCVNNA